MSTPTATRAVYACAAAGNKEEANGILWELEAKLAGENRLALLSALLFTALDMKDRAFQQLVAEAVQTSAQRGRSYGRTLSVVRPSGRRSYATMVGPLLAPPPGTNLGEAVAILFVADPEGSQISTTQVLEGLYDLTPAEAELLRLLAEGNSLEQVADQRGVTMNTARSQLKQVFAKTDTRRQGELVRLVLTGVASLGDDGDR